VKPSARYTENQLAEIQSKLWKKIDKILFSNNTNKERDNDNKTRLLPDIKSLYEKIIKDRELSDGECNALDKLLK
jgi:uncharacterized protein YecE (DUF72 family)